MISVGLFIGAPRYRSYIVSYRTLTLAVNRVELLCSSLPTNAEVADKLYLNAAVLIDS